jgi:glucosamine-6-phosphate deaminase
MEILVFDTRVEMGIAAAEKVAAEIALLTETQEQVNIIFAAAPSQNEFLAALLGMVIPWNRINAFHMDEYLGLASNATQGFGNFLKERLFDKVPFRSVHLLNGNSQNVNAECVRYSQLLEDYPTDIVCLGIGENGHLAFNDPPVANFADDSLVKLVELDHACRQQQVNDNCFDQLIDVPTHALTLTIPALMQGKLLSCVVPSKTKTQAVYDTINQSISELYPSTIMRIHKNTFLFLDKESASKL